MPATPSSTDIVLMANLSLAAYDRTLVNQGNLSPVSAASFGMGTQSAGGSSVKWTFANGVYKATVSGGLADRFDDRAVANIYVGTDAAGKSTLALAFRGTDGNTLDKALGWGPQMKSAYYPLFKPLINAVKAYAATNGIDKILVTGHSLGAAMAQYAMKDLPNTADTSVKAAIFGSPGAVNSGNVAENRMIEFAYSQDAFTLLKSVPFVSFHGEGRLCRRV
jgi:pimeloyl-ACP methyl ester carboxylesterase